MAACKDLTGQVFGYISVLSRHGTDKFHHATWLCKCVCGKEIITTTQLLRSSSTKSCGCMKSKMISDSKIHNINGQKYGRWLVIEYSGMSSHGDSLWLVECECGTRKILNSFVLLSGKSKSCGCLHREYLKSNSGNKHYKWDSTITERTRIDKRTKPEYREWRLKVFKRDNYTCQKCCNNGVLEAHHIFNYKNYPDKIYEIDNGVTLCVKCHKQLHKKYGLKTDSNILIKFLKEKNNVKTN